MKFTKKILFIVLIGWGCLGSWELSAQNPVFSLPTGLQATVGATVNVPMSVDIDLSSYDIRSYTFVVQYNASWLRPVAVQYDDKLAAFNKVSNTQQAGKITLTGASTTKIQGSGTLLTITFEAIGAANAPLTFAQAECVLNEGVPTASYTNGQISISPKPAIAVKPNTAFLAVGQTVQCNVEGNKTAPFSWGLTNPSVGNISESGLFTATGHGKTKVFVQDAAGLRDTTDGLFNVTAARLYFPAGLEQWQGLEAEIPVKSSDFSSMLNVVSGQFTLTYHSGVLKFLSVDNAETLLANASVTASETAPGVLRLAFASSQPLAGGNETLVKLRFKVLPAAGQTTALAFSETVFNETVDVFTENGSFRLKSLPVLTLTPATAALVAGDSLQFTVSNGIKPYSWSVSDERVAKVRPNGWLITKEGGKVDLTVTDSVGATKTIAGIAVSDMRIYFLPDTLEKVETETLTACFSDSIPAGRPAVSSFEGEISVSNPQVKIIGIETDGTMTEGWQKTIIPVSDRRIKFYLAGANAFRQHGTVFYLKTELKPDFKEYHTCAVQFHNPLVNEGAPEPLFVDGLIEGKVFTEQDKTICLGESTGAITVPNAEGKTITHWKKRVRRPIATPWQTIDNTTATYTDTPDRLGEWEYRAMVDGEDLKIANILVKTIPDVIGEITGESLICRTPATFRYVVKRRPTATEYRWNYTGSGVVLHPAGHILDMEITKDITPGTLEMRTANACGESTEKLTLTIQPPVRTAIAKSICRQEVPYLFGSQSLTESGVYTETFSSVQNCDSVVTLTLTVNNVNVSVAQNGATLTAALEGATYQWLDCNNGNAPIEGETNQSFTAAHNGKYAVRVTHEGCTDISACMDVTGAGLHDSHAERVQLYPNPAADFVVLRGIPDGTPVDVYDATGRKVLTRLLSAGGKLGLSGLARGLYVIGCGTQYGKVTKK